MVLSLWRIVWWFLKELKIELLIPYDPTISLLSIYSEKMKTIIQKDTYIPMFTAVLFTIAKTWKPAKHLQTDEWIKMWFIYTME